MLLITPGYHRGLWTAGDGWHLDVYICQLMYSLTLTAADILQPHLLDDTNNIASAMRGHLVTASYWWNHPFRTVRNS